MVAKVPTEMRTLFAPYPSDSNIPAKICTHAMYVGNSVHVCTTSQEQEHCGQNLRTCKPCEETLWMLAQYRSTQHHCKVWVYSMHQ